MKALVLIGSLILVQATPGKDFSGRPLHDWYKSLKQPGTEVSCCDVSDCHEVEARTKDDHWEVFVGSKWWAVPNTKVLKNKENPTGSAVSCFSRFSPQDEPYFYCFVAPSMI